MATMNISLPDRMKEWVEQQVATGRYANASDYMRDLVRRDEERTAAYTTLEKIVEDAYASGVSERSPEDLRSWLKQRAKEAIRNDLASHEGRRARS